MSKIQAGKFTFTLRAEEEITLPRFAGSTLRGAFGHALRKACCVARRSACGECILRRRCVYSYVFETPAPEEAAMMRLLSHAPHPFVLEPPDSPRSTYEPGSTLKFGMVLIGRALPDLPYFIHA
ncbi:MAG: CRISPR-associated protein Cas6, partial [Planctomycetota bacterium]